MPAIGVAERRDLPLPGSIRPSQPHAGKQIVGDATGAVGRDDRALPSATSQ
jgi:hypothetical protein